MKKIEDKQLLEDKRLLFLVRTIENQGIEKDKKILEMVRQINNDDSIRYFIHLEGIENSIVAIRKEYDRLNKIREKEVIERIEIGSLFNEWVFKEYNIPLNEELRDSDLCKIIIKKNEATEELMNVLDDELGRLEATKKAIKKKIAEARPIFRKMCEQLSEIYKKKSKLILIEADK